MTYDQLKIDFLVKENRENFQERQFFFKLHDAIFLSNDNFV